MWILILSLAYPIELTRCPFTALGDELFFRVKAVAFRRILEFISFPQMSSFLPPVFLFWNIEALLLRFFVVVAVSFYFVLRAPKGHPEESLGENTQFTASDKANMLHIVSFPCLYCKNNWGVGEGWWTCGGCDGRQPWVIPFQSPVAPFLSLPIKLLQILHLYRITWENPL